MANHLYVETLDTGSVIVRGDIHVILNSRRAYRLLKDNSSFTVQDDSILFDAAEDFTKTLDRISRVAKLSGCDLSYAEKVSDAMDDYLLEERKFELFSKKALSIRENQSDIDEFKAFKDSLITNMPNRTLYDLQMLSAYHMAFSQNACNFSVPGAGKTSVVYGAYAYLKNLSDDNIKKVDRLLIIGPLSSFGPWESEYAECFGRKPTSKRLVGQVSLNDKKQYLYEFNPAEITLLSYASVPSLIDELLHFLTVNKVMVVLDEAHKIKNTSGGITATSVMQLAEKSKARVVLTGTPAPNGYEDLCNLFKFIWPTKNIIRFQSGQLRDMSKTPNDPRVKMLLDSLLPYFVRVRKSDLGIPPAINHPPIYVKMHESQRRIYEFIEESFVKDIEENKDIQFKKSLVRARLIRLMQAATNPELLRQPLTAFAAEEGISLSDASEDAEIIKEVLKYHTNETPAKFEAALSLIKEIINNKGKVVVWACYIKTIELFRDYLQANGIPCRILFGATPVAFDGMTEDDEGYSDTREAIIKEFHQQDSPFNVIIANPFAVAESISLHKACHNAIYIERSFNCAHFIQSKDRIHRYGLASNVETNYYYLISENTVDSVIDERLNEKEQRLLDIIESMPIPLFDNTMEEAGNEDIKAVLRDYAKRVKEM